MKQSTSKALFTIIGLLAGFGIGVLCSNIPFDESRAKGDVTKVLKFKKDVVSEPASAFQEKLMNDSEALQNSKSVLTVLSTRMKDFDLLVNLAIKTGEGIRELAPSIDNIKKVRELSSNAKKSAQEAMDAFEAMTSGKPKAAADYDNASQKLSLAYIMVDRQANVGRGYVNSVDEFLKDKDVEKYMDLALARDLWAKYCASQAVLRGSDDELAYWAGKASLIDSDVLADAEAGKQLSFLILETMDINDIVAMIYESETLVNLVFLKERTDFVLPCLSIAQAERLNQEQLNAIRNNVIFCFNRDVLGDRDIIETAQTVIISGYETPRISEDRW